MLRKSVLDDTGIRFSPEYFVCEDYALWVDLAPHTEFHNLDEMVLYIRTSDQNITYLTQRDQRKRRHRKFILDEIHRQALDMVGIRLSENDLLIFNSFVGDTSEKIRFKKDVDELERVFDVILEQVKSNDSLDYKCFENQCKNRLHRYRENQICSI